MRWTPVRREWMPAWGDPWTRRRPPLRLGPGGDIVSAQSLREGDRVVGGKRVRIRTRICSRALTGSIGPTLEDGRRAAQEAGVRPPPRCCGAPCRFAGRASTQSMRDPFRVVVDPPIVESHLFFMRDPRRGSRFRELSPAPRDRPRAGKKEIEGSSRAYVIFTYMDLLTSSTELSV